MYNLKKVFFEKNIEMTFFFLFFIFILFVNGAVPFYALPTLGQAIWTTGFSQSFINDSVFNIFAHNIGAPAPAAMAFGLSGAWPIGLLIKLGMHPADAYSSIAAVWLGVAYFSAYKINRFFGVKSLYSTLMAALWLTMPTIWMHAGYSMVSWGIALLSFYYYRLIKLSLNNSSFSLKTIYYILFYFLSMIISIFMDGYSFIMFVIGASILIAYIFLFTPEYRRNILFFVIPTHLLSLLSSYYLYTAYIGKSSFNSSSIDFFRGWGLDLSFIAIPSKGVLWVFDALGLSIKRNNELFFGDASVWVTTFSLPIILVGIFSWWSSRRLSKLSSGLLILSVFSFYMSLGPSLKINSTRTVVMLQTKNMTPLMSSELAIIPTGSAWVSENIPGFNAMRASYRWSAVGIFACWLLFSLYLGKRKRNNDIIIAGIIFIMILGNLPHLSDSWKQYRLYRTMFLKIDFDLVFSLKKEVKNDELIAFLPYKNDFMINYLASKLNVRTYNIGGDKNLQEAQREWPSAMIDGNTNLDEKITRLLLDDSANAIIIPYFDTLSAAHFWPCDYMNTNDGLNFKCPNEIKSEFVGLIEELKSLSFLSVSDSELFAIIRVNPKSLVKKSLSEIKNDVIAQIISNVSYPIIINSQFKNAAFMFDSWHSFEPVGIWSKDKSVLNLPVPNKCQEGQCTIILNFGLLNASTTNPVVVKFSTQDKNSPWNETFTNSASNEVSIPLPSNSDILSIKFEVIGATSPQKLGINDDTRTLGINLHKITLKEK